MPREISSGKTIIAFTPVAEKDTIGFADASNEEVMAVGEEILNFSGKEPSLFLTEISESVYLLVKLIYFK